MFKSRYKPIEIDARNVRFPDTSVKPLRLEITSAEQGKIVATGELNPQGGDVELNIDHFPLAPFNPYALAYLPYAWWSSCSCAAPAGPGTL